MFQDAKFDFKDKVVIVTGASSGLGAECARAFAEADARVVIVARRKDKLDALKMEIEASGGKVHVMAKDVGSEEDTLAIAEETKELFGRIDAVVNMAGISRRSLPGDVMADNWDACMDINLRGTWPMCRAVLPIMEEQKSGHIVNVSSVNSKRAFKNIPIQPYYASKGGILGLTQGIAAYYGKEGINCNAVLPGLYETEMTAGPFWDSIIEDTINHTPMDRPGQPKDITGPVLFLASDLSNFVTGQGLSVDGGYSICM